MDDLPLTGELTDVKDRAERLDEGIDLIRVLWEGGKRYHGRFYDYEAGELDELTSMGGPLRQRIPIWVVAVWPRPKSMNRALRCEGVVPQYEGAGDNEQPEHAQAVREWLDGHGGSGIDVVAQGETPADDSEAARAVVADSAQAGDLVARDALGDAPRRRRADAAGEGKAGGRAATPWVASALTSLSGGPQASHIRLTDWWDSTGSSLPCWTPCRA